MPKRKPNIADKIAVTNETNRTALSKIQRGHPSKASCPMGGGQPKVDDRGRGGWGGGSTMYRTSINRNIGGKILQTSFKIQKTQM